MVYKPDLITTWEVKNMKNIAINSLGHDEPIIGRNSFQSHANIYQFIPILQSYLKTT